MMPEGRNILQQYHQILWNQNPETWKNLLEQRLTHVSLTGGTIKIRCPYHDDKNPSAILNVKKQYFKCYASQCNKYTRDPIAFLQQAFSEPSYEDAFSVFRKAAGIKVTLKPEHAQLITKQQQIKHRKQLIAEVVHEYLVSNWSQPSSEGAQNTINWLKKARGVKNPEQISSLGMIPSQYAFEQAVKAKGGTEEDWEYISSKAVLGNAFDINYMYSAVFIYATAPDNITAFKIRKHNDIDKKQILTIKDTNSPLGFFGLLNSGYVDQITNTSVNVDTAYVVEGEFDQLSIYQGQIDQYSFDSIFLGFSGNGNNGLDSLVPLGLKKIHVIADDDDGGEGNVKVLLDKTTEQNHKIFVWPNVLKDPLGQKTDPDSLIRNKRFGFAKAYSEFLNPNNYISVVQWATDNIEQSISEIDSPTHNDIKEKANEYLRYLKTDETATKEVALKIAKKHQGVTHQDILGDIQAANDTPEGFIIRIMDYLKEVLIFLYHDEDNNAIHLWHKKSRREIIYEYHRTRPNLTQFEIIETNPDGIINWAKNNVGLPSFYPDPEENSSSYTTVEENIRRAVSSAIQRLAHGIITKKELKPLGSGIHFDEEKQSGYILTGKDVYRFSYENDGKPKKAEKLSAPVHSGYSFGLGYDDDEHWLKLVQKPSQIFEEPTVDVQQLFNLLYDMENKAFEYRSQRASVLASTILPFYSYLCCAYKRSKAVLFILGEHGSGKSAWLSMHLNGDQLPGFNLTYAGHTTANYISEASIRNNIKGISGRIFGLDEAVLDDKNPQRSKAVQSVLQLIRPIQTSGSTKAYKTGEKGGRGADEILSPFILAADSLPTNSMDQSRLYVLEMKKNPKRDDLQTFLTREFKHYSMDAIRRDIFLHSMRMLPKYRETVDDLLNELADTKRGTGREAMTPALLTAVYKMMGFDNYIEIYDTLTSAVNDCYQKYDKEEPGNELFSFVCNAQIITLSDNTKISFRKALCEPNAESLINNSNTGLCFYPRNNLLVVSWDEFKNLDAVRMHSRFRSRGLVSFKHEAAKSFKHRDEDSLKNTGIADYLKHWGVAASHKKSYFHVEDYVNEAKDFNKRQITNDEGHHFNSDSGLEDVNL